jgi:hypothetical protein
MKKFILCTALVLMFLLAAGCQKKDIKLTTDDIKSNSLLVKNDGTVQAGTVEKFDKDYYSEDELKQFINDQIANFNKTNGQDAITMDSLEVKESNAVLILNYSSLNSYNAFNKVDTTLTTTASVRNGEVKLPDVFVSAADGAYASPEAALENDKYKVLILHENTDVFINGSIKYYTTGTLEGKTKLQTGSEDETVIVYKP